MIQRLLKVEFTGVASAAFLIGGFSLVGKIVGLTRNSIFAAKFGAGEILDVYYSAFLVPDFIYNILVLGFLSAVFIPLFIQYFHKDKKEAWHFTNATLNALFVVLGIVVIILFFLMPYILPHLISGLPGHMKMEAVFVSRIMLISPLLLGLSSIFGSIVQSFKRYVYFSLAPIFYNLGIIFGALYLEPWFGIYGLAFGVLLGALLHLAIQFFGAFGAGFRYEPIFNFNHSGVLKMARLSIARFSSIAASQINFVILIGIASFLGIGSITIFNFANDLQFLPIGLIGLSYAVAVFPKLSDMAAKNDKKNFVLEFSETFRQILFFVIPLSVTFFLLRNEIVYLVYGVGGFSKGDIELVGAVLGFFALSIFAQSVVPILNRTFYALQNTWIPFITDLFSFLITIILGIVFVKIINSHGVFYDFISGILGMKNTEGIAIIGLPMAFSVGAIVNFVITLIYLKKKVKELDLRDLIQEGLKLIAAAFIMGVIVFIFKYFSSFRLSAGNLFLKTLIYISMASVLGTVSYLYILYVLRAKEFLFFKQSVGKIVKKILAFRKLEKELPEIDDLTV